MMSHAHSGQKYGVISPEKANNAGSRRTGIAGQRGYSGFSVLDPTH